MTPAATAILVAARLRGEPTTFLEIVRRDGFLAMEHVVRTWQEQHPFYDVNLTCFRRISGLTKDLRTACRALNIQHALIDGDDFGVVIRIDSQDKLMAHLSRRTPKQKTLQLV